MYEVPSTDLRANASFAIQPYLNAFPQPNHEDAGNGLAYFVSGFGTPSSLDATSVRIDQNFSYNFKIFGRYSNAPSHVISFNPSYTGGLIQSRTDRRILDR